ncbi:glycosyltransferase family 2 protein [Leeuwenhoekiella marinoflava]|uniref:glycosyltransferase family 2 protein n=1 Tax=Leeuwenhoekiella marinoflava TaxID=988 RepID=UPI003003A313
MKIAIVIVTYNGMKWLKKCLTSVYQSDISVNVIVVDNNSQDGTIDFIKENFKQIHLIATGKNLGFGKANNIGMRKALENGADYLYLLNQDAYLESSTLSELVRFSEKNSNYGILSPMQYNGDGTALDPNFKQNLPFKNDSKDDSIIDVEFVMAAHWLLTRECILQVGLFDPIFKHYGEDNDYINRALYHGYRVGVVQTAKGLHDRFFRKIPVKRKLEIYYRSNLSVLTNINLSFSGAVKVFLKKMIPVFGKSILKLRILEIRTHTGQMINCIWLLPKIIDSRKENKKEFKIF